MLLTCLLGLFALLPGWAEPVQIAAPHDEVASRPPMGWNSWNCFGTDVNERQVRDNVGFMVEKLQAHGWEYVVVDMGWYLPPEVTVLTFKQPRPPQAVDENGRLVPDVKKFPSARAGDGFRKLADDIHRKGLKFGIHIMRGIPWQAVERNTPIAGSTFHAKDAADPHDLCEWYGGMSGVKAATPAGRAYYRSIVKLYAGWGVDFIKFDDASRPYHAADIEALREAIQACGRPIVLSLSPGASPIDQAEHLRANANLWRISQDFWDTWEPLKKQFELCRAWAPHARPGRWPDCDMIPLGKLRVTGSDDYVAGLMGKTPAEITNEYSRFNDDEKRTLMTLWCVFRSPLFFGGHLPETDATTLSLITNGEALAVNQQGRNPRELRSGNGQVVWTSELPQTNARIAALFNLNDSGNQEIRVAFGELGLAGGPCLVRDLWKNRDVGTFSGSFTVSVPPHGAAMLRISATERSAK